MSTLPTVELGVLGPLQVRQGGAPVSIPGAKPRAILTMLGLHGGSIVSADTLVELLWGEDPPRTAAKALQTHISSLRRALGDGVVVTEGAGWTLQGTSVDATRYKFTAKSARDAAAAGDSGQAVARFEEALALWRGVPELPDGRRGLSEKTRWIEGHAALVEDRADALLATGRAAEVIGDLEAAVSEAPLRERRWGQLMLALYRAGRQGEALGAYQRARSLLAEELGVDPGPELRRLEAAIVAQDGSLDTPAGQQLPSVTRAVTFLLTDIEGSTAAWEADAEAMATALARHDEIVEQVVTSRGGRLIKTRGEGDATFSVFERPSAAAAAAIELQAAISQEPWALREPIRIRVALHTGEAELRDGDYFGRAVNRAARLRSLAAGAQILCSGATAELVIDSLPDDVMLSDLGMRQLRNLPRPEHVFELRLETVEDVPEPKADEPPVERPALPAVLVGPGPFVGRGRELERLYAAWQTTHAGRTNAILIAGEPGVGKTRLAGEWSRQAYDQGALVIYGRCDEDLGAPYQPFAEALRSLVPCLGGGRLRGLRGVEALLPLVPGLSDVLPDLATPTRADPDTERYALFDAVVALLEIASASVPLVLILDDLHWAAKPTLLLLRHLLRFGDQASVQILGTYRSTDLDRSHPLAAMLADLHRDGTADRLNLSGLDEADVTTYVAEAGYDDEELAHALASVTGGNPFFLIEALRHVDESGGVWDQSTLPQGVREAVSRRLSRLTPEANKALGAAAVVGSRFALELVERVVEDDLIDVFDEACKAGIVIEEPGGRYRFNHALVRQSLLAELPSVRRMRLHQRIATTLENEPGADDELLAELAYHYFECAWAGNASKAVLYCRRAADQAMARLAYEGAAELYDRAFHALEEIDEELPDRDDQTAELLIARCEALLAAGDVTSAAGAVSQLQSATVESARLAAWATCFDGQLSMLTQPERLDEVELAVGAAAGKLAELDDAAGEAMAHTVRAGCLARLGRIGDCEIALDDALTAARRAREHRRVNAVLAGAPLAALWGPNPVPRAGGRCLDVVRLLRITTDSPAVEATSTRCQAVLEAFRGRAAAARRMIDSARRTVTELGLRHAALEVEQYAGIVELVIDDLAAAESHLRLAYNGFRRMGLDADTAETAALLGGACLALGRDDEADELCTESERLAGHAQKASTAWRTLRAQLLSRGGQHDEARRMAEAAVSLVERSDALVDHGDACLALAMVLGNAGDSAGARATAERAVGLYERKGAAALADKARAFLGERVAPAVVAPSEAPVVEIHTAAARTSERVMAAINRQAWDEFERLFAPGGSVESRRKIVGFRTSELRMDEVMHQTRRDLETGRMRANHIVIAVRGEQMALARVTLGTLDMSPGAPQDEFLQLYRIDKEGRITLQVWFDLEDMDAAIAELDAAHARFEEAHPRRSLENVATRVYERLHEYFATRDWNGLAEALAADIFTDDRRPVVNAGIRQGPDAVVTEISGLTEIGVQKSTSDIIATRGEYLALSRARSLGHDQQPEAFYSELLHVVEINTDQKVTAIIVFDLDDFDSAVAELDARYLAGEASAHAHTWSVIAGTYASVGRRESPAITPDCVTVDHRRATPFGPGELSATIRAGWDLGDIRPYVEVVHQLSGLGAVCSYAAHGVSHQGFDAEWQGVNVVTVEGDFVNHTEFFDEANLDAALARFEQLSQRKPLLHNAATQAFERFLACFAARDWDALAEGLSENISHDDRRRIVGAGPRQGRGAVIAELSALVAIGVESATSDAIATRGERVVLTRLRTWGSDDRPEAFHTDALHVVEVDTGDRLRAVIVFDHEDSDAAIAELDARYLAGEAAEHARTWSAITRSYDALNRREMPPTTQDWVNIDRRRHGSAFAPGELPALLGSWELASDVSSSIEAVHRLDSLGTVISSVSHETSQEGFEAEWRSIAVLTVERDLVDRLEVFDAADIDVALARFEELHPQTRRLENAASQAAERFLTRFAARDWAAVAAVFAENFCNDDRRRVVGAGVRHGRDAEMADLRSIADVGITEVTSTPIATRGEFLVLTRGRLTSSPDHGPEAYFTESLSIVEIDTKERIVALVSFDLDDFEAAIAELDTRFIAGEAAAHAHTWSIIAGSFISIARGDLPLTTTDCVSIDHRRAAAFAPGDLIPYLRAGFDLDHKIRPYFESVLRLNDLGAVVTHAALGTSREGFDAEWRGVNISTVEGGMISRCEIFDEADLDAALATFDELNQRTPRLQNAASQVTARFRAYFAVHEWDAVTEMLADNLYTDDRRRVVGAGVRRGREAHITDMRAIANLWDTNMTATCLATRGERLVLERLGVSDRDQTPEAFLTEVLSLSEIDADERIVRFVTFDADDIDAAFEELDARYLAGEATTYADIWTVITRAYSAFNRHQLQPMTPDWVTVDRRLGTPFEPDNLTEPLHAIWDLTPDLSIRIEAVHRLDSFGAVITHAAHATSHEGLAAEWRAIDTLKVEGNRINRCEVFDEADLHAALARFEELRPQTRRLENAASEITKRFFACFGARNWAVTADILSDNSFSDDRRRAVNAGLWHGRDLVITQLRKTADIGVEIRTPEPIATRGRCLALSRVRWLTSEQGPEAFPSEALCVAEIGTQDRLTAIVMFDPDDIDAAFAELDARYLAGEAVGHGHAWSIIARACAAFNRGELPLMTTDSVNIDHRSLVPIEKIGLGTSMRAGWENTPNLRIQIEAVHRLTDLGAVVTQALQGTSQQGFAAEWRMIGIFTLEGEMVSSHEAFDEAQLETALARFAELHPQTRPLENAASQVEQRFLTYFAARDWDAYAEILSDNVSMDDRRHVVNAGVRHGRDAEIASQRAVADVGVTHFTSAVIAVRGERLALCRYSVFDGWSGSQVLCVSEINVENQIVARVAFDPDDIDAAFQELESRYTAGEGSPYRQTWFAITTGYAALNRHEVPATTPDWVNVDHRRGIAFASGELAPYIRATFDVAPNVEIRIEVVHRLTSFGAVISYSGHGTSQEGFDAVWRETAVFIVDGDLVSRCEMYDETDLDAAIARFEELQPPARILENAATRAEDRFFAYYQAHDWAAVAEILADDSFIENRVRVVNTGLWEGRDVVIANMQALAESVANTTSEVVAIRGERLALTLMRYPNSDPRYGEFAAEQLIIAEIDTDERITAQVVFDPEDLDPAFEELETRYLAGEAAEHAHTWSVIARECAAFNRHEPASTTPDPVYTDHRPLVSIEGVDLATAQRGVWDLTPDVRTVIEAVHRLSQLGAIVTQAVKGTSPEGFDAEWQMITIFGVEGDLISRYEAFDATDLDAALARFEELQPQERRLDNAAIRVSERLFAGFAAGEWDSIRDTLADDFSQDDRRRVVGAGVRHGRDEEVADLRAIADLWTGNATGTYVATRGQRLDLMRLRFSLPDQGDEAFVTEMLGVGEINADERIVAAVSFDPDDIDAAFEELESRYLAGEGAPHANTWLVIMQACAALNRREIFATTADFVDIDHRSLAAIESGDLKPYIRAALNDGVYNVYIEAVHRLSDLGAVVTLVATGTSQEGFDGEWRMVDIFTVGGDLISRCEIFDEADVDAALARFEELQLQTRRLGNAASRMVERFWTCFATRNWAGMAETLVDDCCTHDYRHVVSADVLRGRAAHIANMRAVAEVGFEGLQSTVIATRGDRLALIRIRSTVQGSPPGEIASEMASVIDIDADGRIVGAAMFDADDIDAAFEKLESRYCAGEAAAHAHTWSVVAEACACFNRHEVPATTPDSVAVEHRPLLTTDTVDLASAIRAVWDLTPEARMHIATVHRLSDLGAVITYVLKGTSQDGFDAEWRMVEIFTVEGDRIKRCEIFDEEDLEVALARFDELDRPFENGTTKS